MAIERLQQEIAAPDFHTSGRNDTQTVLHELKDKQSTLELSMERWSDLEHRKEEYEASRLR